MIKDGRLKALAISSTANLQDPFFAQTARSQGVDYINSTWCGILAPSKTPIAILETLKKAVNTVTEDSEVKAKLLLQGLNLNSLSLGEFDAFLAKEADRITPLFKTADSN